MDARPRLRHDPGGRSASFDLPLDEEGRSSLPGAGFSSGPRGHWAGARRQTWLMSACLCRLHFRHTGPSVSRWDVDLGSTGCSFLVANLAGTARFTALEDLR